MMLSVISSNVGGCALNYVGVGCLFQEYVSATIFRLYGEVFWSPEYQGQMIPSAEAMRFKLCSSCPTGAARGGLRAGPHGWRNNTVVAQIRPVVRSIWTSAVGTARSSGGRVGTLRGEWLPHDTKQKKVLWLVCGRHV